MGRVVRKVPPGWEHPKDARGNYIPLMDGQRLPERFAEWVAGAAMWERGLYRSWSDQPWKAKSDDMTGTFADWEGKPPNPEEYMPVWPAEICTMFMMYEDTSEGTPISPAFETPEELARWLATTGTSAFGNMTATYEQWLATIQRGFAVSMIATARGLTSGVAAMGGANP